MIKRITIIVIAILSFSCEQSNNKTFLEPSNPSFKLEKNVTDQIFLSDLIPEHLPDSSKVEMTKDFINNIDSDTSLLTIEITDTIESRYIAGAHDIIRTRAKYKNDTLVKLSTTGIIYGYESTESAYYFLLNELMSVVKSCTGGEISSRCGWVHGVQTVYLYYDKIIAKDFQYGKQMSMCGCYIWIEEHKEPLVNIENYRSFVIKDIAALKQKIENYR